MSDTPRPPLVLASASPRRKELLASLGLRFEALPADLAEHAHPGEPPERSVRRLAAAKARAVHAARPEALVLGADTLVVLDGDDGVRALGKPAGPEQARQMLRSLSGRDHRVLTGIALCRPDGTTVDDVGETTVRFDHLDRRSIDWYVSTGEPLDKAGAYAVQGAASLLIRSLRGSWSNVVGLPVERLPALFAAAGDDLLARLGPAG